MSYVCACQGANPFCPTCTGSGVANQTRPDAVSREHRVEKEKLRQLRKSATRILSTEGFERPSEDLIEHIIWFISQDSDAPQSERQVRERQERESEVRRILLDGQ